MAKITTEEKMIATILNPDSLATSVDPVRGPNPTNPKAALRRCRAAWQRAFDAYMATKKRPDSTDKVFAAMDANEAYRNAMPLLAGPNGVRDFIACAAHGILIGAIKPTIAGQLLYAAQIAMNSLFQDPKKQPKARKERKNCTITPLSPHLKRSLPNRIVRQLKCNEPLRCSGKLDCM